MTSDIRAAIDEAVESGDISPRFSNELLGLLLAREREVWKVGNELKEALQVLADHAAVKRNLNRVQMDEAVDAACAALAAWSVLPFPKEVVGP